MREVRELELAQLCGQLLVVGFEGKAVPQWLRDELPQKLLGGVILFGRNATTARDAQQLCIQVLRESDSAFPPWLAIDQEGGRVQRLRDGLIQLPPMRSFGELDDLELTTEAATAQAAQLRSLGFNLNFAPVVDVDSNPDNPVIGDRSFGAEPALVTRHARAVLAGFKSQGLAGCLKHFPGHGDTVLDSHLALPTVDADVLQLRQRELYPFERLAHGAPAVMTAHVLFPAFDDKLATFSPRLLDSLLRREFAFDGVVFSDDLEMGAVAEHYTIQQRAVLAVSAGCDALLICSSRDAILDARAALVEECQHDAGFRARCEKALIRNLKQRRSYRSKPDTWSYSKAQLGAPGVRALRAKLARL